MQVRRSGLSHHGPSLDPDNKPGSRRETVEPALGCLSCLNPKAKAIVERTRKVIDQRLSGDFNSSGLGAPNRLKRPTTPICRLKHPTTPICREGTRRDGEVSTARRRRLSEHTTTRAITQQNDRPPPSSPPLARSLLTSHDPYPKHRNTKRSRRLALKRRKWGESKTYPPPRDYTAITDTEPKPDQKKFSRATPQPAQNREPPRAHPHPWVPACCLALIDTSAVGRGRPEWGVGGAITNQRHEEVGKVEGWLKRNHKTPDVSVRNRTRGTAKNSRFTPNPAGTPTFPPSPRTELMIAIFVGYPPNTYQTATKFRQ